ncbi:MAG: M28 family peptidase [Vicinamibacterales bacterium]
MRKALVSLARRVPTKLALTCIAVALFSHDATLQNARGAALITEASIRAHMEFLAGDAMKGRGSGTEDEWRAAEYIGSQMRRLGMQPLGDNGRFVKQIDTGRMQTSAPPSLTIKNLKLVHGRDMLVQTTGRGSVSGVTHTYKAGTPSPVGAILIVPDGVTPVAAEIAPAALVITAETAQIRSTWDAIAARLPPPSGPGRGGASPPPARIVLAKTAFDQIWTLVADGTTAAFQVETKTAYTWNAIGRLTGTDSEAAADVILLTAHLDHLGVRGTGADTIFNGADDDASGSVAVLELAEAISKGPRPKRTMIFAWFGSEEAGGFGARDFLANPPVPLKQITANIEFEMIANRDPKVAAHTLWLTGYDCSTLGRDLARQGARLVADPHPTEGFFSRSDNIQLARLGVIAQTVSSFDAVASTTYHKVTDEVSTVDFAHMTDSIRSMLTPVLWLANSKYRPTWLPGKDPSKGGNCGAR